MRKLSDELKTIQQRKAEVRAQRAEAISKRDRFRAKCEGLGDKADIRAQPDYPEGLAAAKAVAALGDELTELSDRETDLLVMLGRADETEARRQLMSGNGPEDRDRARAGLPAPFGDGADQAAADALTGMPGALLSTIIERRKSQLPDGSLAEHLRAPAQAVATLPIDTSQVSTDVETLALIDLLRPRTVALASGIQVIPMDGTKTRLPRFTDLPVAEWTPEGEEMPESGAGIEMVDIEPGKIGLVTPLTVEVFEDLRPPVLSAMEAQLIRAIALGFDAGILFGDGTGGKPLGVANTTGVGVVTAPLTGLAPFAQAIAALIASNAGVSALAMNPLDIGTLLQLVEFSGATNSNVPLWRNAIRPDANGQISSLELPFFGVPLWPCPAAPQGTALLYDARAIAAVIRRKADLALDPFYSTRRGLVALRSYLRGDVLVAQAAGAVRITFDEPIP